MSSSLEAQLSADDDEIHRQALALPLDALASPRVADSVATLVRSLCPLLDKTEQAAMVTRVVDRLRGLGPLEELLQLDGVTDVMINGPGPIWIERHGELQSTTVRIGRDELNHLVERIVTPLGRRLDRTSPLVDGRLADGARVHVAAAPVAVDGPYLTVRRFERPTVELEQMASPGVVALLEWAVEARANVVVAGGTSSGKTTLLNTLVGCIPEPERLVSVEDAAELQLCRANVARLEARPAAVDGPPPVTIRELVRNALRMRPDRIIVGEVRGEEAIDMLQAMNTGHEGSLSTVHANSPVDALSRLESMVLLGSSAMAPAMVRQQVLRSVDLVVQLERTVQGQRRIGSVAEPLVGPELEVRALATAASGLVALPQRARRTTGPSLPPETVET